MWFRYEKDGKDVVKDLSMQVHQGELYCILGGNGTGKSTTLSLLCGIRTPYRGKVILNGQNIRKIKDKERYNHFLGVLPQNPQTLFVGNTVQEDLDEMLTDCSAQEKKCRKAVMEQVIEDTEIQHLLNMHLMT